MPPPKGVCILIPEPRDSVSARGKRSFADVMELRTLRQEDYPGLSAGPNVTTRIVMRGRKERQGERGRSEDESRDQKKKHLKMPPC